MDALTIKVSIKMKRKRKKISIPGREYSMKEYIKTWGVGDDFFIVQDGLLKGNEHKIWNSKVGMKDGKVGLMSNTGPLKKFFKKETFLPFETLFPTKKKIYINYCDGTNFGTLDTLNRCSSEKENINQIFKDYYNNDEDLLDSEESALNRVLDGDPYMEDRDEETWETPHPVEDEWEYLKAHFNHDYQNEYTQIFLLEEPLSYAKRQERTKKNLFKYVVSMNQAFEKDLDMINIKIS